jgi:hypothetical protein
MDGPRELFVADLSRVAEFSVDLRAQSRAFVANRRPGSLAEQHDVR